MQSNEMSSERCVVITIRGIVQGVGFRPFVYRLGRELDIHGEVCNTEDGVVIKAQAPEKTLETFIKRVTSEKPPLAMITRIEVTPDQDSKKYQDFTIKKSTKTGHVATGISPDVATCKDCLKEIFDPSDRRFGYPFTNCTNCGPRYTIMESLPYDRSATSMKVFQMCKSCLEEYEDPLNRRFHAQPNACPDCGPTLSFQDESGNITRQAPLKMVVSCIKEEKIVAIKGLGGFHLACDAYSDKAVSVLRQRKKRPHKPFAIMVKDVATAKSIAELDDQALHLLKSQSAPIVVVPQQKKRPISEEVSPNISDIGIMLPYTPLHHLLFHENGCPDALVMTSGNPKNEPLCTRNSEAKKRLGPFVDSFLFHNRQIHTGVDDSVLRPASQSAIFIRRSRGYAPAPVNFPLDVSGILGTGGELKNTFCIVKDGSAYISQHIGNLTSVATYDFYKRNIKHLASLLDVEPLIYACDLHPDYLSTRYAMEKGKPLLKIQHHFAHAASVMAEHGLEGPVLALCLDGTGLGNDGTVWGGEVLICTAKDFKRVGRIRPFLLPGGDACAKSPWRTLISVLTAIFGEAHPVPESLGEIEPDKRDFVTQMALKRINSPVTSSCGRLFDAVAALSGLTLHNTYEGQAGLELESSAYCVLGDSSITQTEEFKYFLKSEDILRKSGGLLELDWWPFFNLVLSKKEATASEVALLFHAFVTAGFSRLISAVSHDTAVSEVVVSGGCLQNRILLQGFLDYFLDNDLKCYKNEQVPANDGGICLGQAFVAAHLTKD